MITVGNGGFGTRIAAVAVVVMMIQLLPYRDGVRSCLPLSIDGVRHRIRRSVIIVSLVYPFPIHHLRLRSTRSPLLVHDLVISPHSDLEIHAGESKKNKNEKKEAYEERGNGYESLGLRS